MYFVNARNSCLARMELSLVYIGEQQQFVESLQVEVPCSVRLAIEQSGILGRFP